ncbi:hypothetical protein LJC30_00770 [Odoribacter sp. OttesenSCG-928-L07]|nr:hypothetical protein [Odoribacter sp. OttesenSCG-928-L07]MDL2238712.1 thiol oxidoreductase [Bacteroidales bacterium OttesenSCG-928-L14]MDL2241260.1 thiol oxidoreductase [Bacteroidales bacterium OttesenSCG-928-K22]
MKKNLLTFSILLTCAFFVACDPPQQTELSEEYYSGGVNGTAFNRTSLAYEQPAPAVKDLAAFKRGEKMFENNYVTGEGTPFSGLGPVYIRSSCIACHPVYGRSKRVETFNSEEYGNGYLVMIHTPDGKICESFTGMLQTRAVPPYLPPVDESGIHITWHNFTDQYGNVYPDGTPYSLIYPTVEIDRSAILLPVPDDYQVSIEGTIGIFGTGLLDAITDEDLFAERDAQVARGYYVGEIGGMIKEADGSEHPGRYTYGCTRGTLQNGPGSNAIWNITNVTRPDRNYLYTTKAWVEKMGELGLDTVGFIGGFNQTEMTMAEFDDFMIWHRGLAVPAARDLDDDDVKAGKEIFYSIGCTACHKPTWTTGTDQYIPGFSNQKIWPYTDLLKHDLGMKEPGLRKMCRTTPLWGRGLSYICAGHTDMLHDLRARNYEEAILWHFGDAEQSREKFRNLSKEDRHNLVRFLESI